MMTNLCILVTYCHCELEALGLRANKCGGYLKLHFEAKSPVRNNTNL